MENYSFSPPIKLVEEGRWLLAVTSFELANSVFNITNENNSFPITIPGHWNSKSAEKTFDELYKLFQLRSQNDIDSHVQEVRKRGNQIDSGDKEYKLSDFDTSKNEILEEIKNTNYRDLEDLVYRMQVVYDEISDILDLKYIPSKRTGYSLNPGMHEVADINAILKHNIPKNVKVRNTIDDIRLKSNIKINQTLIFNKSHFSIRYWVSFNVVDFKNETISFTCQLIII